MDCLLAPGAGDLVAELGHGLLDLGEGGVVREGRLNDANDELADGTAGLTGGL